MQCGFIEKIYKLDGVQRLTKDPLRPACAKNEPACTQCCPPASESVYMFSKAGLCTSGPSLCELDVVAGLNIWESHKNFQAVSNTVLRSDEHFV